MLPCHAPRLILGGCAPALPVVSLFSLVETQKKALNSPIFPICTGTSSVHRGLYASDQDLSLLQKCRLLHESMPETATTVLVLLYLRIATDLYDCHRA